MHISVNSFNSATNTVCTVKGRHLVKFLSEEVLFFKNLQILYNRCSHCTCFYVSDGLYIKNVMSCGWHDFRRYRQTS
jgi:hypothetical protein